MTHTRADSPLSLSPALERLVSSLERRAPASPEEAAARIADPALGPADLAPWADFLHPATDSYGRRPVRIGERFELMVMSWAPGDYSAIHDHGATQWGAVRYFGPADHAVFCLAGGRLSLAHRSRTPVGSVASVDASLVHLMGNPTETPFLSLHLYGCDAPTHSITGGARIFDCFERRIQRTDGGVFFVLPEEQIERREPAPPAEPDVVLLHHRLMRDRVERIRRSAGFAPRLLARSLALSREIGELERRCGERGAAALGLA